MNRGIHVPTHSNEMSPSEAAHSPSVTSARRAAGFASNAAAGGRDGGAAAAPFTTASSDGIGDRYHSDGRFVARSPRSHHYANLMTRPLVTTLFLEAREWIRGETNEKTNPFHSGRR